MNTLLGYIISFVLGFFANYVYGNLSWRFQKKKRVYIETILKDTDAWVHSYAESYTVEIYSYEKDPDYSIVINPGQDSLSDRFKKFPDKEHDRIHWVEVKYKNVHLFGWNFMYLDGSRYLIPVPDTQLDVDNNYYDYYNLNRTEFLIFEIIGKSVMTTEKSKSEGLKNIAKMLNITVVSL